MSDNPEITGSEKKICPCCEQEVESIRVLTEGEHKHRTNALSNNKINSYCVEYKSRITTSGAKVMATIYFHQTDLV